jgi:hypothetical protein
LGRCQRDKQGHASAKGNAVASLVKGGKVVRKGNLATKKDYNKTASWRTRNICQGLQNLHDGEAARRANLPRWQLCQGWGLCPGRPSAKMGHVAAVGKFAKDSNVVKKQLMMQRITMHCKWCRD